MSRRMRRSLRERLAADSPRAAGSFLFGMAAFGLESLSVVACRIPYILPSLLC
jgi:hypothetical protein